MDTSTSTETRRAIEAIILVSDTSVDPSVLAQLLEIPRADVEAICDDLAAEYEAQGRGFVLARVAGGYRYQTHPDTAPYIERFVLEGQNSRLSAAALETLAIVAYKQPISRMQVAAIRGVNVDGVMRTLQQRGYIDETGRDPGPGNATLFGTTPLFLERVGLDSCDDLPPLAEFVPGADVVEALEEGLRPEAIDELLVIDDTDTDDDADAEGAADGGDGAADGEVELDADAVGIDGEVEEADELAIDDLVDEDELDADELGDLDAALAEEAGDDVDVDVENAAEATEGDNDPETDEDATSDDTIDEADDVEAVDNAALDADGSAENEIVVDLTDEPEDDAAEVDLFDPLAADEIDLTAGPSDPDATAHLDLTDDLFVAAVEAPADLDTDATATAGDATGVEYRDVPIPKAEPIIEITRPVAPHASFVAEPSPPPPGQAPFRSTPGHTGAGDTEPMANDADTTANPGASDEAPDSSS